MNSPMEQAILIPITKIVDNPYQHRDQENPADVQEIAISIAQHGLQQYPAVRAVNGHYELIFGHTRTAAYRLLATSGVPTAEIQANKQYEQIPVYVRELTDKQMFEMAIVENLKRRDPKPTEKARAIQKYMTEFNATSKEAGELFGMNDATARGMVRLLDLTPEAQSALDEGRITQGTARTLLSMQKIAPSKVIAETLKDIEKKAGEELPESVIEYKIKHLPNVFEMWDDDRRDGKPRSDWQNGWLLDMKNFPNKYLPELTKEEAALDAEQQAHLINPPSCTACPFYTKVHGVHFCGMKACHTRKTTAWYMDALQQASKNLGIAIYDASDGPFRILDDIRHERLFKNKDKGLRLVPSARVNGNHYQYFDGISRKIALVVAVGATIDKVTDKAGGKIVGGKMTEKEKAERRAMKLYRMHRLELFWEYTAVAKSMFDAVPVDVLNKLNRWENILIDDRIPEEYGKGNSNADHKADYQRRALVWRLIKDCGSHYHSKAMTGILADMQELTGAKAPRALINQAEQWDAEINAAAKPVAVETKGKK